MAYTVNGSPLSSESASLSSSFISSAASDMLPADSSQSDTDHSVAHLTPLHPQRPPNSSSPVAMGQSLSKPSSTPSTPVPHKGISLSAAAAGVKLKRAFAARRKRADTTNSTTDPSPAKKLDHRSTQSVSATFLGSQHPAEATARPQRGPKLSLQMATQVLIGGKKSSRTPLSPVPPPLPPKPANMQGAKLLPPLTVPPTSVIDQRSSIIALSPGISSAVNFMRQGEQQREEEERRNAGLARKENELAAKVVSDHEADKRKSDSTMSYHTIRPGASGGNRTPRPVSMAESFQTICGNNRRSTFEDGVPEESALQSIKDDAVLVSDRASPTSSLRSKKRRSVSLNVSPPKPRSPPPLVTEFKHPSKSLPDGHPHVPAVSRETPTLTRAAAQGIIAPSTSGMQSTGNNIRGRLAAWTATSDAMNSQRQPTHHNPPPKSPVTLRQTAISVSNGLAPAAGLAKRAVEKMGRWGGFSSSSSTSGYSSSSSSNGPSSYDHTLVRTSSNHSSGKKYRRTPDAPSGAWSVHSSASVSDSEAIIPSPGPSLGIMIRAPLVKKGPGSGGVVFGRDLHSVVRTTAIGVGAVMNREDGANQHSSNKDALEFLQGRMVPALIARCAQHLLIWGVQEEGLFRVSGRPAHVSKLRNEFDSGADFDMRECSPGELDPHAVASIFKAFLRELPEPILTRTLIPYFEEALAKESSTREQEPASNPAPAKIGGRGPGLPSGPKAGFIALRKPPSLSTLAMPSFQGMAPPSKSLINALKSLVCRLPSENRDLLKTVTELIKATASHHKQTKMPLSNLLLVFCPSLNMNPPLLRILCETDSIWDNSRDEDLPSPTGVLDIKRDSMGVLDISASSASTVDDDSSVDAGEDDDQDDNEKFSDARDGTEDDHDEGSSLQSIAQDEPAAVKTPIRQEISPISPAQSIKSNDSLRRTRRPMGPRQQSVPTVVHPEAHTLDSSMNDVDLTSDEGMLYSSHLDAPPPLSSSAESLTTPSSSSAEPSLEHLPVERDEFGKMERPSSPIIADPTQFSFPATPRKEYITGPIEFPTSGSVPSTPLSPRRSVPLLSLPSLGFKSDSSESSASSAPASPRIRLKRPSMNLFSKRSASALAGSSRPVISSPYQFQHAASESSVSTPQSAVTAAQSSPYVIDTPVDSSPLRLGLGLEIDVSPVSSVSKSSGHAEEGKDVEEGAPISPSYQLGSTPIADRFKSESSVSLAPPVHLRVRPTRQASEASFVSVASSSHLDLVHDEPPDEWTKSVLLLADRDWQSQS